MTKPVQGVTTAAPIVAELKSRIERAMYNSQTSGRPFCVVVLQLGNFAAFKKRNAPEVVANLMAELYAGVRKAMHPSQFVAKFHEGLAIVLDGVDVGAVDMISRRLAGLAQHIIRTGRFNDFNARWADIIYQFLFPNKPLPLFPKAGWAVFPRDGASARDIMIRAMKHAGETVNQ